MNELVWENVKSQLILCENCGRIFVSDRLDVYQRVCKFKFGKGFLKVVVVELLKVNFSFYFINIVYFFNFLVLLFFKIFVERIL